jgi:hypothetical protein
MGARHATFISNVAVLILILGVLAAACDSDPAPQSAQPPASASTPDSPQDKPSQQWSGMYTFLKEGEFVQLTVEDQGQVTGFVSRYGDGDENQGFQDQFFKSAKLDGNKLTFTTKAVRGVWFAFQGAVERGEGKNPGDEAYFVLKGALTENTTDANKKVSARSREVVLKMFPQEAVAGPAPVNPSPKN